MSGDLTVPSAGLRRPGVRLRNRSNAVAKVQLVVPAGDELEVGDDVAAQLLRQSTAFDKASSDSGGLAAGPVSDGAAAIGDGSPIEEAGGGSARRMSGRRKA